MLQSVLIAVHLTIVIALVASVLLQRSEGGALGAGGGGGGFMTGRGQANALTRTTAILAAMFFATSIALTLMANFGRAPASIFTAPTTTSAPAAPLAGGKLPANVLPQPSTKGTALDALKQYEQQRGLAAPAVPAAPVAPAVPAAPATPAPPAAPAAPMTPAPPAAKN